MNTIPSSASRNRLTILDTIRGFTLCSMILYHFLWDLVFIAGISMPWYHGTGAYIWQQCICRTFILLSGFCWSLGKHPLKRGSIVVACSFIISAVTCIAMPENRVLFGVLTLLGSSMLLLFPLDKLFAKIKRPPVLFVCLLLSFFLFELCRELPYGYFAGIKLPKALYANYFTAYLGFPASSFYSTDYFALLPWFPLFVAGYFLFRLLSSMNLLAGEGLKKDYLPPFTFIGRHSLFIYLLHQPILYGITLFIMNLI